jgi:hypothetical protein
MHPFYVAHGCYIEHKDRHWLVCRALTYDPRYQTHGPGPRGEQLSNVVVVELDKDNLEPCSEFKTFDYGTLALPSRDAMSKGLEDLRLYVHDDKIKFLCTTLEYSTSHGNKIVSGELDIETLSFNNCQVIDSPYEQFQEKNWIGYSKDGTEYVFYTFYPLQIGQMVDNRLCITCMHDYKAPTFFKKTLISFSTPFVKHGDKLYCILHYAITDNDRPNGWRRYYHHFIVELDEQTFRPLRYSDTFIFHDTMGIEYTQGFTIRDSKYIIWYSRHERNVTKLEIQMSDIPLRYNF